MELIQRKEIILSHELRFADAIGSVVLEKPQVSVWMIFIPIFFLFFIYRMQRFKKARAKFVDDFMKARQNALDLALEGKRSWEPQHLEPPREYPDLPEPLQKPYAAWIGFLAGHYEKLLEASGDDFGSLVQSAYENKGKYQVLLNRLNQVEENFYTALKPYLDSVEGAFDIVAEIQSESRRLRSKTADTIFS